MSLEQNICGCYLLLKNSFVEKEYKSLGSLITLRLGYVIVGTVGQSIHYWENIIVYLGTNLKNSLQANYMKRQGSLISSLPF